MTIERERCFNHPLREAVAHCPECGRPFCRECVSEHDDRLLCAFCLEALLTTHKARRGRLASLSRIAPVLLGFAILWLSCYLLGELLVAIPPSFHVLGGPSGGIAP